MLGTCYVTSGWREVYDGDEAKRLLKYLQSHPAGYHCKNAVALDRFMSAHGQSCSYLQYGDVSSMFTKLAKTSPLARAIPADLRNDGVNDGYERRIDDLIRELGQEIASRRVAA